MHRPLALLFCLSVVSWFAHHAAAEDWTRFRGPGGSGLSTSDKPTPTTWSDDDNLKWKAELPGPGLSSPIVIGDRVVVTCWSGYGVDAGNPGEQESLKRHVVCFERGTGKQLWSLEVEPYLPEDDFRGMFAQNGYASHTPATDGTNIYVFFGKTGALAVDLAGNKLWQTSLGTAAGARGWGSASSPIVYNDLVIFTASAESESLVALNKETGEEVWRAKADGFSATWGTPVLVDTGDGRQDLVIAVPYEIWGFDPDTGKLRWYCDGIQADYICSSVVAHNGVVYAVDSGPRGGGAIAVKAGGSGDVTSSHVLWTKNERSRIGVPLYHEGRLYWVNNKIATCIDAQTGERLYQERLGTGAARGENAGGPFGQRGGRGGGGQDYASPVAANGKLYYVTRSGETYVTALGSRFEQLAVNRFAGDAGEFSATPAIADGQIFLRSTRFLYCLAE